MGIISELILEITFWVYIESEEEKSPQMIEHTLNHGGLLKHILERELKKKGEDLEWSIFPR